jgi:hypothetical protein
MLKRFLSALVLVSTMAALAFGQCENQACRGSHQPPSVSGNNSCFDVLQSFSIDDGAPCHWDGTVCVGDPCPLYWNLEVTLNPCCGCDTEDCEQRLLAIVENCSAGGGQAIFAPSPQNPTYFVENYLSLECGCSFSITVRALSPTGSEDPCFGAFSSKRGVNCSECKGL